MQDDGKAIGLRISQIRKDLGLNKSKFAVAISGPGRKFDQPTITRYESGEFNPKVEFYEALSEKYNINPYWIRHGTGNKYLKENKSELISEPDLSYTVKINEASIYGEVFCGAPASQWQEENVLKTIPTDVRDRSAFGVIAKGNSMEPYINDKDILICVDNPHLIKDKSAVVTVFKSEPETTNSNAKLIKRDLKNKTIILYSINTRNPPEVYKESEILKIYKVVRIIREVK